MSNKYNWRFLKWTIYLLLLPKFGTNLLTPPAFIPYLFAVLLQ